MQLPASERGPAFGGFVPGHRVSSWWSTPLNARGSHPAMPLAKPFEGRDNPDDRNAKAGQTPYRIGHSKKHDCQHSGRDASHKGDHQPKYNESPGAFVASHSRLQNQDITSQGLRYFFTPTLNARKPLSIYP
jgi:hypothetical protein